MFKKVLIANRGEVAVRVIRACQELNISTVAVYSEADKDSLHVKLADEAICIGPPPAIKSYLNIPALISAAQVSGADAIHPGYGFLAENSSFAEICKSSEITFIGPSPQVIEKMGHKSLAKKILSKVGLPVIPGTKEPIKSEKEALTFAQEVGYPLIVKAAAGGGGRGMRIIHNEKDLLRSLQVAQAEAHSSFGNSEVYLEKYLEEPRHIEVQILGDSHGNIVYLGERDCSIQRRHQKLIEESPCSILSSEQRESLGKMAVKAGKTIGYQSAGTVEFLMDNKFNFYFMEMNTRIQVEHPVTEMVTGIDIVKEQILIAAGEKISFTQEDVKSRGHSIEFRINAEDINKSFLPTSGRILRYIPPGGIGVRVDSHLYTGFSITPFYDSLLAKLVVWGRNREEAIIRGRRALNEFIIEGVPTTIPFHLKVVENAFFQRNEIYTNFVSRRILCED